MSRHLRRVATQVRAEWNLILLADGVSCRNGEVDQIPRADFVGTSRDASGSVSPNLSNRLLQRLHE
jgi:hypothetical protein